MSYASPFLHSHDDEPYERRCGDQEASVPDQ
jgi:hypothetical protein